MCRDLFVRRWMLPLFMYLAAAVVRPADAQSIWPTAPDRTIARFRTGVDLVAVNVTVLDPSQRLVSGLPAESFEIFEDGVRQDIAYFESRDVPLDVVLLIDTSGSMYDKLRAIQLASASFARALRPGDRGAVMTFNRHITTGVPLTAEKQILDTAIRSIKAGGGTSVYDSVYIALRSLTSGTFLYLLAYSPKVRRLAASPGFRRIAIRLHDVPDATPRARSGYAWARATTVAGRPGAAT